MKIVDTCSFSAPHMFGHLRPSPRGLSPECCEQLPYSKKIQWNGTDVSLSTVHYRRRAYLLFLSEEEETGKRTPSYRPNGLRQGCRDNNTYCVLVGSQGTFQLATNQARQRSSAVISEMGIDWPIRGRYAADTAWTPFLGVVGVASGVSGR